MRKFNKVTDDLEIVLMEMTDEHKLQWGEILNLVRGWLEIHRPDAREEYKSGGNPIFYYGHIDSK